jgi:hypothetical protein
VKNSPFGALAQLGERLICIQEVNGSIPLGSIFKSPISLREVGLFAFAASFLFLAQKTHKKLLKWGGFPIVLTESERCRVVLDELNELVLVHFIEGADVESIDQFSGLRASSNGVLRENCNGSAFLELREIQKSPANSQ